MAICVRKASRPTSPSGCRSYSRLAMKCSRRRSPSQTAARRLGRTDLRRRGERPDAEVRIDLARVVERAVLHHHPDGFDRFEILDRIARNQKEVRQLAFL